MFPSIGSYTSSYLLGFAAGVCFLRGVQLMLYSKRRRALSKGINRAVRTQIQQELRPGGLLYRSASRGRLQVISPALTKSKGHDPS